MKQKIAKYVSTIGHPMFTISAFVIIAMFANEEFHKALLISFLVVGCVIIPNVIRNFIKTKKGQYTNFDVSDRNQRNSMYLFALPLLFIITVVMFYTRQSSNLCLGVLFGLLLLIISYIVNFFIKCSGHVSLTIYLSFLILPMNIVIGAIVLLASGLIGWSRIELKRHTLKEVITGAIIGLTIGVFMILAEGVV